MFHGTFRNGYDRLDVYVHAVHSMFNLNGTKMKKSAKTATLALALFTGISSSALANGNDRYPTESESVKPTVSPESEPYRQKAVSTPAISSSDTGPYVSGSIGAGFPDRDDFKTGYLLNGGIGYNFNPIRVEAAVGYQHHDLKHFDDDVSYLSFMGNGYYDFDAGSGIKPYLMAGAGVTSTDKSWSDNNSTNFAWQVGAGLGFKISDNTTFDLGYRYFRPDNGETSSHVHNVQAGIRYQF